MTSPTIESQVPAILESLPARISDVINPWVERTPEHPALVEASGSWTYAELAAASEAARSWLFSLGVRPGDRVMLVFENCRAFIAILFALAQLDAWPVLVNARLSDREIDEIRVHCGARRVIYMTGTSSQAAEHAQRHGAVVCDLALLGSMAVSALDEAVSPEPLDPNTANRVAVLIYTSGTTGAPKGVMLTHRNLLYVAAISARIRALKSEDRVYGILPMSHAVGLSVVMLGALLSGSTLYLSPRNDAMTVRRALDRDRLTVVLGVPAMFSQLLSYAKLRGLERLHFPALRIISSSGAPLDPKTKSDVERLFDMPLYNGYGVTECSPNIGQARIDEPCNDSSVGRVFPGMEVKFMGDTGHAVSEGEIGELWVRGPNVMKGYYRAPQETSAAIDSEGWFNTRDLARLQAGRLFIVGRTKDLIVRHGFNVYPAEVEAVLNAHPAVLHSAVIGRVVNGDEEVIAFVQLAPDAGLSTIELAEYAALHLAPYKRPSHFQPVTAMPVTPTGKIAKSELAKSLVEPAASSARVD